MKYVNKSRHSIADINSITDNDKELSESGIPVKDFVLVVYLLVPLAWNFTKRWTPCQIIYKVFDHKSR